MRRVVKFTVAATALVVVALGFIIKVPKSGEAVVEALRANCQREFGERGEEAVLECFNASALRYLREVDNEKMARVYSSTR